jgi:hypothetical protein
VKCDVIDCYPPFTPSEVEFYLLKPNTFIKVIILAIFQVFTAISIQAEFFWIMTSVVLWYYDNISEDLPASIFRAL